MAVVKETFSGKLDILVNNAASGLPKAAVECTEEDYSRMMGTNLESSFHLSQLARPLLLNAGLGGSIVNISSIGGSFGFPGHALYSISKGGMNQLTRSLATEWAQDKIRVNCVAPGLIPTDMTKDLEPWELERERSRTPMRRNGEPADVASVVSFLCMAAAGSFLRHRSGHYHRWRPNHCWLISY